MIRTAPALIALAFLAACGNTEAKAGARAAAAPASAPAGGSPGGQAASAATEASAPATGVAASPESGAQRPFDHAPEVIRGIYLNAYAASGHRLRQLLALADRTEINTFVVDVKDERGPHYESQLPLVKQMTQPGQNTLRSLKAFADTIHAHKLYLMARIVVFKDPILSKAHPDWSIRRPGSGLWMDKKGNTWVSAWDRDVWDYNIEIAQEAAKAGFDEIQFDYVRFPEPFPSLPPQVHPEAKGNRTDAIVGFLN
ncbi:MAG TPA: putative glycoside hydrolase, partial [Longimicrobiales bacterium]